MNLKQLGGEHTVDIDLLPEAPLVLDVGCRGFEFDREILALRPKARIIALDPDPTIEAPPEKEITFLRAALTHRVDKTVIWQGPGEGAYITASDDPYNPGYKWGTVLGQPSAEVPNYTLRQLMQLQSIARLHRQMGGTSDGFDLVKLDCEGSEFGILENWPGPIATQISVEFHDTIDRERWNDEYFKNLFAGPLCDYRVIQHELLPMGPGPSYGHWDDLLILNSIFGDRDGN